MEKTKSFEDLNAWKQAHYFTLEVYKITEQYPKSEQFGLTSQFRKAAVSIAANIAEGYKKRTKPDKLRMFNVSQGSLEECRYYIILSKDLNFIGPEEFEKLMSKITETSVLLNAYCLAISKSV